MDFPQPKFLSPVGLFPANRKRPDGLTLIRWQSSCNCKSWDITVICLLTVNWSRLGGECRAEDTASRKEADTWTAVWTKCRGYLGRFQFINAPRPKWSWQQDFVQTLATLERRDESSILARFGDGSACQRCSVACEFPRHSAIQILRKYFLYFQQSLRQYVYR